MAIENGQMCEQRALPGDAAKGSRIKFPKVLASYGSEGADVVRLVKKKERKKERKIESVSRDTGGCRNVQSNISSGSSPLKQSGKPCSNADVCPPLITSSLGLKASNAKGPSFDQLSGKHFILIFHLHLSFSGQYC